MLHPCRPTQIDPEDQPRTRRRTGQPPCADRRRARGLRESGLSAPFSAVAKRAGVGQGSLYRHFPDRTALAVAVFEENVIDLEEFTAPDGRTIDDLLDRVVDQAVVSTALIELITADLHDPRVAPLGERFGGVVARLSPASDRCGHVGDHVEPRGRRDGDGDAGHRARARRPGQRPAVAAPRAALFRSAFAPR